MTREDDSGHPENRTTFVETDIDCLQCLEDVRSALDAIPWVDEVEEDARAGCFVVHHHGDSDHLATVASSLGHRLLTSANGEVAMGVPSVSTPETCPVGHARAGDPGLAPR